MELSFQLFIIRSLGFGPEFIWWVRTLHHAESCFINNGLATDFFSLERGVRQGDPLSPCLFVVAVETLALAIRQNREIFGIKIGGVETNFLQYADDTTAVLSDIDSAQALLTFSKYSRTYQDL